jgi:hypothetical protein
LLLLLLLLLTRLFQWMMANKKSAFFGKAVQDWLCHCVR